MKLRDALLSQRVHEVLGQIAPLSGAPIRAVAQDGVVRLRGTVGSAREARLAETIVSGLTGVRKVINELEVRGPAGFPHPYGVTEGVFHADFTLTRDEDDRLEV
ncbi:MAG: BON domain-containing protein [Bacillota bacterium]|jgi:hypothetical protein|nr:BON domain-containing protein [Bacillota bacterium]